MSGRIGIIGGSGLYEIEGISNRQLKQIDTPFGNPSDEILLGEIGHRPIAFLPRHGRTHKLLPSEINYRANIWAMKSTGVDRILSVSAVGSFKESMKPLDIVIVRQFVDRTRNRKASFFGDGVAVHVMFADPVCKDWSDIVCKAAMKLRQDRTVHETGTYLNMEGPAFSTRAESFLYKSWDMDVIGMTNLTEAKLAREAEICFASMAMVTDYDCWRGEDSENTVSVDQIVSNLRKNSDFAKTVIKEVVQAQLGERKCECGSALQNAVITKKNAIEKKTADRLSLLLGPYLE